VEKNVLFFAFPALFRVIFLQILPQLKTFFVPNLTFLGLLGTEIPLGEKPVAHPNTNPAYFAIREPQRCALRNEACCDL